ncbi:hypothetical protein ACSMXM_01105 [Pacificimonas sp. ICDLI1SI03]
MRTSTAIGAVLVLAASPLHAEVDLSGFGQVRQVISTNNNLGSGTAGWIETSVGGNADIQTRRVNGSLNAVVARRFEEFGDINRNYRVNGNANIIGEVLDDHVFLTVGGTAQQYDRDLRGFVGGDPDASNGNRVQAYAGYIEPSLIEQFGSDYDLAASYRLGYTTVDGIDGRAILPGNIGLDGRTNAARGLTDSVSQSANGSIGSTPGRHKLGIRALGSWMHEDIEQLDQRYTAYSGSALATYQVDRKLSLTFQGGYEDISNTQQSILFDPDTGLPVVGEDGEFVADPAEPRRTAFERTGPFGTAGFRYVPNSRMELSFEGGYRYGDPNFNAFLNYQLGPRTVVSGRFNQGLSSFGRLLTQSIDGQLVNVTNINSQQPVNQCILGVDPITGGCVFDATQAVLPATFRSRRGELSIDRTGERLFLRGSLFYYSRGYVDLQQLQVAGEEDVTMQGFGGSDDNYGARIFAGYDLSDEESVQGGLTYTRSEFALSNGRSDNLLGGTVSYSKDLGQSLSLIARGNATFRLSSGGFGNNDSNYNASVGINYRF